LDAQPDSLATKVKLYNAAIMTMHKIGQYSFLNGSKQSGMLFFARYENTYVINATFPVSDENKALLDDILKGIKNMSQEELEQDYQEKLKHRTKENVSLPGLGFTQLVLVSKSWDYEFDKPANLPEELVFQVHI
jgi:hypothetical protein